MSNALFSHGERALPNRLACLPQVLHLRDKSKCWIWQEEGGAKARAGESEEEWGGGGGGGGGAAAERNGATKEQHRGAEVKLLIKRRLV